MNDLDQRLMLLGRLLGTVRGLPTAAMYLARHGGALTPDRGHGVISVMPLP